LKKHIEIEIESVEEKYEIDHEDKDNIKTNEVYVYNDSCILIYK